MEAKNSIFIFIFLYFCWFLRMIIEYNQLLRQNCIKLVMFFINRVTKVGEYLSLLYGNQKQYRTSVRKSHCVSTYSKSVVRLKNKSFINLVFFSSQHLFYWQAIAYLRINGINAISSCSVDMRMWEHFEPLSFIFPRVISEVNIRSSITKTWFLR